MVLDDGRAKIGDIDDARPAYWARCEKMGFEDLRQYMADCLEWRGERDAECPGSREEFQGLLTMLVSKAEPPDFKRSEPRPQQRLNKLGEKRRRTARFLEENRGKPGASRKAIRDAKRNLEKIEREIRELQDVLRYNKAEPDIFSAHYGAVERLRRKIDRLFLGEGVHMIQHQWVAVPSGPAPVDAVLRIYRERQQRNPITGYHEDRLEKVRTLNPVNGHMGRDQSEGYVIFTFEHTPKALMECPKYGNAIFVIDSNLEPERWLQMNKQEVIEHPDVTKIAHREGWFERVRRELGTGRSDGTAA